MSCLSRVRALLFKLVSAHLLLLLGAIILPVHASHGRTHLVDAYELDSRATQTGSASIDNINNTYYLSEITVGGKKFKVLLDTGSIDLVLQGSVPHARDSGIRVTDAYAVGTDKGKVTFATVEFAGLTVQDQVFNNVPSGSFSAPQDGILGLGPYSQDGSLKSALASDVFSGKYPGNAGDAFLDRVFQQDPTRTKTLALYLSRDSSPGSLLIGEVLDKWKDVQSMPPNAVLTDGQWWALTVDGATGNDGKPIDFPNSIAGAGSGKLVSLLDSGTTFPQVPAAIAHGFYSTVEGARLATVSGQQYWVLPCDKEVKGAFSIGGKSYPVSAPDFLSTEKYEGDCLGTFQPVTSDASQALDGLADMILGMAFIRNVYVMFYFGSFVDSMGATGTPSIQLLSIVDTHTSGNLVAGNESSTPATPESGNSDSASSSSTTPSTSDTFHKSLPYIVASIILAACLVAVSIALLCCRRRRAQAYKSVGSIAPKAHMLDRPSTGRVPYKHGRYSSKLQSFEYAGSAPYSDPFEKGRETELDLSEAPLLKGEL